MASNKITLCLVAVLFIIALAPLASAFEFDNVKSFDKDIGKYGKIGITNSFGFGDKLAEYILIDNTNQCLTNCYAEGTATLYSSGYLFTDLRFKDKSNIFTNINSNKILIEVTEEEICELDDFELIR